MQKYTSFAYSWSTSEQCKKWEAAVADRDEMCENSNFYKGLMIVQCGETRTHVFEEELKMDASQNVNN